MLIQARVGRVLMVAVLSVAGACSSQAGGGSPSGTGGGVGGGGAPATPTEPPAVVTVSADSSQPINPTTPVVVTATTGTLASVTMTNTSSGVVVKGELASDKKSWRSSVPLGYGATYKVATDAVNTAGQHNEKDATVNTLKPAKQAYANVIPAPQVVQATGVGVGQPMVFQFTSPVKNKAEVVKHLHVTTSPPQPGAWYWVDDKDVHYRGAQYWKPGTKITITADVYGVDLGNGVYGAEDHTVTYQVHDAWVAKADGQSEQLNIFDNGNLVKTMPMSLGAPGFPTHEGPHVISDKQPTITMDSCTYGVCPPDPRAYNEVVNLDERISDDGEFVHSAPWSVGQQGNANVSHGCVNLSPDNAQWFYDHFGLGDVVEITNSGGPTMPVWDTYGDWEVSWSQWQSGAGQAT
jgi:lipoprotein-anchoring transpeptidase ErfK/SrfK